MKNEKRFAKENFAAFVSAAILATAVSVQAGEQDGKEVMSDAWLDGKAETVLLLNENLNNFTIDTQVTDGVVLLSGEVESSIDRRLAEELIASIDGVTRVENKLKVKNEEDLGDKISRKYVDTKIATVVKTRLLMDREVAGTDIDVSSRNGTITLSGFVASSAEKDLAEAIARNTTDVDKVVNKLKVAS